MDVNLSPSPLFTEQERLDAVACKPSVLTLPPEIVAEIFIHFLPTYPAVPPPSGPASPTSLTHVCRQWRAIALGTPVLWCAIELDINRLPFAGLERMWVAWTERAGACLLSVYIDLHDRNAGSDEELQFSVYKAFTESPALDSTAARWEHLTLRTAFPARIPRALPALRSLDLLSASVDDDSNNIVFEAMPQLRTAVLHGHVIPKVTLPWTQLTCLTLIDVGVCHGVDILRQTVNLVRCKLRFSNYALWSFLDNTRLDIVLPYLESLRLESIPASESVLEELLLSFTAPCLTELDSEEVFLGAEPVLALRWFILKSGCRLQEVRIRGESKIPGEEYRAAFPSVPTFSFLASDDSEEEI